MKAKKNFKKLILYSFLLILFLFSAFIVWNWDSFYRIQEVEIQNIDCDKKEEILQDVVESDQRVRTHIVSFKEKVEVDHSNLETVISIIETCGMPTLKEVNSEQMGAIWLALQHAADTKHTIQYFPYIEKAVANGDLNKEQYALMKDRILMLKGEPQIYGTQIKGGKLYKLTEPEQVNNRRLEMDMEPIEDYLRKHNIEYMKE